MQDNIDARKMKSLSSVGLGLSIVFGCLLLALVAELYYLLWWKRRLTNKEISDDNYSSPARELFFMFCLKKPSSSSLRHSQEQLCSSARMADNHSNPRKDLLVVKPFDDGGGGGGDENVVDDDETELMSRIHTISGPPRFLFTIIEETREDLESELLDGKGGTAIGRGSLSDLLLTVEESTPYLTPLASPPFFTPPLTPMGYQFFDSSADAEFNKIVRSSSSLSSPPPKFKFLQDAEEKLVRISRMAGDGTGFDHQDCARTGAAAAKSPVYLKDDEEEEEEEDGSFITIIVDKHKEIRELNHNHQLQQQQQHNSKVLPLASPASTTEQKGSIFQ